MRIFNLLTIYYFAYSYKLQFPIFNRNTQSNSAFEPVFNKIISNDDKKFEPIFDKLNFIYINKNAFSLISFNVDSSSKINPIFWDTFYDTKKYTYIHKHIQTQIKNKRENIEKRRNNNNHPFMSEQQFI